ncbi:MAG: hypothetical protein Salg2KO_19830 [Salibacteraceae bacterium]
MWRLTIGICFIAAQGWSQNLDSLVLEVRDSLDINAQDTVVYAKPKAGFVSNFIFQFDNRNERYYNTRARLNGLKIGLEFYKRFRTGFGFYSNNNFYRMSFPEAPIDQSFTARLSYSTWFNELVVFRSFRWELAPSVATGTGEIQLQTFDRTGSIPTLQKVDTIGDIRLYDIGFNTQFKIFPSFGIGAGVGYRFLQLPNYPELQGPFSDPYIDFKIKVFIGYAFRGIFKPEKIRAEQNYYEQRSRMRRAKFREKFLDR